MKKIKVATFVFMGIAGIAGLAVEALKKPETVSYESVEKEVEDSIEEAVEEVNETEQEIINTYLDLEETKKKD